MSRDSSNGFPSIAAHSHEKKIPDWPKNWNFKQNISQKIRIFKNWSQVYQVGCLSVSTTSGKAKYAISLAF